MIKENCLQNIWINLTLCAKNNILLEVNQSIIQFVYLQFFYFPIPINRTLSFPNLLNIKIQMLPNSSNLFLVIALLGLSVGEILKPLNPVPPPVQISIDQFQYKYGRRYDNEEQKIFRRIVLESNKKIINDHNKRATRTYNLGENQFVDLTLGQFLKKYTGLIPSTKVIREHIKQVSEAQSLDKGQCFCRPAQVLRRFQLEKKITKNQQQFEKIIQKKIQKNSKVDILVQQLIQLTQKIPKATLSKLSPTTLKSNPIASSPTFLSLQQPLIVNQTLSLQQSSLDNLTLAQTPYNFFVSNIPDIDWTNRTGPVRHQGNCGACYAFTSVQVLQAANSIYLFDGLHIALSVQQIMDCAIPYVDYNGCNGGLIEWGYSFMKYNGVTSNFRYPYTSGQTGNTSSCKSRTGQFKIVEYKQLNGTCSHLRQELQKKPVSTAIKAANMRFYTSGVFDNCLSNDYFNHAVTIVGFNSNIGWKFKNTWGLSWGQAGYGWLSLDQSKNCGICVAPVVPITRGEL